MVMSSLTTHDPPNDHPLEIVAGRNMADFVESLTVRILGDSSPLSGELDRVVQRLGDLSRVPVTLNIGPALEALQTLNAGLDAIAAKIQALSALGGGGGPPLGGDIPGIGSGSETAIGGMGGSVGLGIGAGGAVSGGTEAPGGEGLGVTTSSVVNHLGGITINVSQPADIYGIVRDLRLHGFAERNRRG